MKSLNKVYIIGRLTRDPDLRRTPGGTAVGDFGMVVNRPYTTSDGDHREEPCFLEVVVWAHRAKLCHERLSKGQQVFVEGRLHLDQWTGKDGTHRSKIKVVAEELQFLPTPD